MASWIKKEYWIIFLIMLTEIFGFSLVLPFLPFYAQEYGASPFVVGSIFTVFSLFQFFSAPIMGKLSDHYGRKPLLILSQLSTTVSFIILGAANALWVIFLSRIVDGMLGSNMIIAQAYLGDISPKKDRSKVFALTGVAFGFGFLIGPAIGGYLAQFSYAVPAYIAAGIAFVSVMLTTFFLKETVTDPAPVSFDASLFSLDTVGKYLKMPRVSGQLWIIFLFILTHIIYVTNFALYAERQLGYTATDVGFILAYVGGISIIIRGFLLPKLIDWMGEPILAFWGIFSIFFSMIWLIFVDSTFMFMVAMTGFAFGSGTLRPLLKGELSRSVSEREQGAIMGVSGSMESMGQIMGPMLGGYVITHYFPGSLGLLAAGTIGLGVLLMARDYRRFPRRFHGME